MKIHFLESSNAPTLNDQQQRQYTTVVTQAYDEAKKILPIIPDGVNFIVQPLLEKYSSGLENGEHGYTLNSEHIRLNYTSSKPEDFEKLLKNVRITIFHELNHAARYQYGVWHSTFLDNCIMEGLANVFTRENTDAKVKWGIYNKEECLEWIEKIKKLGSNINFDEYMYRHPDGRKWIGYKIGTYIVDSAIENSGKSIMELTQLTGEEIFKMSNIGKK